MPGKWRGCLIIPIYKATGDIQECENYRSIKLRGRSERKQQLGMKTSLKKGQWMHYLPWDKWLKNIGRNRKDCIWSLLTWKKDIIEYHVRKCEGVWEKREPPEKYVRIIQDMYERAEANGTSSVCLARSFWVNIGLHQRSPFSPTCLIWSCI